MRFNSIAALVTLIALTAFSLAALVNSNLHWAGWTIILTIITLCTTLLGTIVLQGEARWPWTGYFLFAGPYFMLAFCPGLSDAYVPLLGTTHLLASIQERVSRQPPSVPQSYADEIEELSARINKLKSASRPPSDPAFIAHMNRISEINQIARSQRIAGRSTDSFQIVGHCIFTIIIGFIGTIVSIWFRSIQHQSCGTRRH